MNTLEKRLQAVLDRAVEAGETGGANVLIRQNGQELAYAEAGLADQERRTPIRRDSIFRLYSQTKPVTAAAVMLLVDDGLLDISAFVSDFLPGFANPMIRTAEGLVPAGRPAAVFDLLSMTAGLSYPDADAETAALFAENEALIRQGGGMDTVTFCNRIGQLPLAFEPGSEYRYSTCADVLGAVVELVSGQRYGDFLRERLFEPLGMKDTAFYVPPEKADRLVTISERWNGRIRNWQGMHLAVGDYTHAPAFESGGAGLVSTLDDYARFTDMLQAGGVYEGRRILSEQAVARLRTPQLSRSQYESLWWGLWGFSYGNLMRVCVDPGRVNGYARVGQYGWDGWLGTAFMNDPELRLTVLIGQNVKDGGNSALQRRCQNVVLASL